MKGGSLKYPVSRERNKWEYPLQPSGLPVPGGNCKSSTPRGGRTYFHPPSFICLEFEGKTESLSRLSLDLRGLH
jgi:hypothetical protein